MMIDEYNRKALHLNEMAHYQRRESMKRCLNGDWRTCKEPVNEDQECVACGFSGPNNVIFQLATDFHETYERIAAGEGWDTQKDCKVSFDDLPEENKATMLKVCEEIYNRWIVG
jgi:hypothetical protein